MTEETVDRLIVLTQAALVGYAGLVFMIWFWKSVTSFVWELF